MIAMMPLVIGNIGPGAGEASRLAVGATILRWNDYINILYIICNSNHVFDLAKNTKRIDAVDIELKKQLR